METTIISEAKQQAYQELERELKQKNDSENLKILIQLKNKEISE